MINSLYKLVLTFLLFISFSLISMADLPPDPGGGPGGGDDPVGGGSPISGGLIIMLSLGIGYGVKKIYDLRNQLA